MGTIKVVASNGAMVPGNRKIFRELRAGLGYNIDIVGTASRNDQEEK